MDFIVNRDGSARVMDFIEGVRKFNLAAGRTEDTYDSRAIGLHIGLMLEEMGELLDSVGLPGTGDSLKELGMNFKRTVFDMHIDYADRQALLDACVDIMVVTVGCMMSQGADVPGALGEVNRANLAKLVNGGAIKDANGKIQKPEGWCAPDLAPFVNKG